MKHIVLIISFSIYLLGYSDLNKLKNSSIQGWDNKTQRYITTVKSEFDVSRKKFEKEQLLYYLASIIEAKKEITSFFSTQMTAIDKTTLHKESSKVDTVSDFSIDNIYILDSKHIFKNNKLHIYIKVLYDENFKKLKYKKEKHSLKSFIKKTKNIGVITTHVEKNKVHYILKIPQEITAKNTKFLAKRASKIIASKFYAAIKNTKIEASQNAYVDESYKLKYASKSMENIKAKNIQGIKHIMKEYNKKNKILTTYYKVKLK